MSSGAVPWSPKQILRPIERFSTGSAVIRVETDQGEGFLKAMGVDNGPHILACELVGTLLARRLGLTTLNFTLIEVPGDLDLRFADGKPVQAGPGFITRAEKGRPWSGDESELTELDNPRDIELLVVFDTWTMNCDRYRPPNGTTLRQNRDNVWFSEEEASAGKFVLKAIDHGCCFTCEGELTRGRFERSALDDRLYGLFPPFRQHTTRDGMLKGIAEVETIVREEVESIIGQVPQQWQVDSLARSAWCDWIVQRARTVRRIIEREWPPPLKDRLPNEGEMP
jgi:hypothetical protein